MAAISGVVILTRPAQQVPKVLIVDQLGQTSPNPTFVNEAGTLLAQAGYRVYYTPYQNVTVDFYRELGRRLRHHTHESARSPLARQGHAEAGR